MTMFVTFGYSPDCIFVESSPLHQISDGHGQRESFVVKCFVFPQCCGVQAGCEHCEFTARSHPPRPVRLVQMFSTLFLCSYSLGTAQKRSMAGKTLERESPSNPGSFYPIQRLLSYRLGCSVSGCLQQPCSIGTFKDIEENTV